MKFKYSILHIFIAILLISPFFLNAAGLVPCQENCNFNDFLTLINNVVDFVLIKMVLPIAAIIFAFTGFRMLFNSGNSEVVKHAKTTFLNVLFGLVIAVAAWLIVHTFLSIVGYSDASWLGF